MSSINSSPPAATEAFTVEQVGDGWGVSPYTVRRMIARGELRAFRIGRSIRIHARDIKRAERAVTSVGGGADV